MIELEKRLPRAAAAVRAGIDAGLHRGGQVYISLKGEPIADAGIGESRPGVAMTSETLSLWLSAGKPLGAIGIALLMERGLIELDAPVAATIPEFAAGGKAGVTVRHLLTHSGGFRTVVGLRDKMEWDAAIALICKTRLEPGWVPGETAGYHAKSSWWILGELIRRLDGRPYGVYLREAVCGGLGMRDVWNGMGGEAYRGCGERIGWMFNTDPMRPGAGEWRGDGTESEEYAGRCIPGANTRGPIRELGRFYEMLLAGGEVGGEDGGQDIGEKGRKRFLKPETVELFTTIQLEARPDLSFRKPINWGLGFIVNGESSKDASIPYGYGAYASPETFGHGGRESTVALADPRHGLVVAATFNGLAGEARHQKRMREFCGAVYEDLGLAERA